MTTSRLHGETAGGRVLRRKCGCGQHLRGGSHCSACNTAVAHPSNSNPLPRDIRSSLEKKYGEPLSGVRVQSDHQAAERSRQANANAMSEGERISFAKGRYRPHSAAGRQLIDHEVVHVLQQRNSETSAPRARAEQEAETLSGRSGQSARPSLGFRAKAGAPLRDAKSLTQAMNDELDDVFVGMDNVWPTIRAEDPAERKKVYADPKLRATARDNASEMELLKTYLLLKYGKESNFPAYFKAFIEATDFLGTHEARIYALLRGINKTERQTMREMPGVMEVIEDEFSFGEEDLAKQLLASDENRAGTQRSTVRPSVHLEKDDRLNVVNEVFRDKSFARLVSKIEDNTFPGLINDMSLWSRIADNFGVAEVWYLRMIVRAGKRSSLHKLPGLKGDPYVTQIWKTVKGAGTKEEELTVLLTEVAKNATELKHLMDEPWFLHMLRDELSGSELYAAMQAVKHYGTTVPKIKPALIKAINSESRDAIRKLLRDKKLTKADRERLRTDPEVVAEMGDDLKGPLLAETGLLLMRRTPMLDEERFIKLFYAKPVNADDIAKFLGSLGKTDADRLLNTPGMYFMVLDSGLSLKDRYKVLAAFRSHDPDHQIPGSEGTHHTHTESVSKNIPASFTADEIRIPVRGDIDYQHASSDFSLKSSVVEDWTRVVDEHWNGHFEVASAKKTFPLVFVPYLAKGISNWTVKVFPYDNTGRRSFIRGQEMHLFVGKDGDELETITFAHEFGHVLGNPDEYALTPSEYKRFLQDTLTDTADFESKLKSKPPRGGQDFTGMMANQRKNTDVYARHASASVEIINRVRDKTIFKSPFVVKRVSQ